MVAVNKLSSEKLLDLYEPSCHALFILTFTFLCCRGGFFSLLIECCFFIVIIYLSLWQQPNFKQKFVALLKRFKVTDEVSVKRIFIFRLTTSWILSHNEAILSVLSILTLQGCCHSVHDQTDVMDVGVAFPWLLYNYSQLINQSPVSLYGLLPLILKCTI